MSAHFKVPVTALSLAAAAAVFAAPAAATPTYPPATPSPSVSSFTAASSGSGADNLPRTGGEVAAWSGAGAALVLGGVGAVVVARRRPQRSH